MPDQPMPKVFYDGACPLCTREIAFYKRRQGADGVAWVDVSGVARDQIAPGLNREQALARFHVQMDDGSIVSGGTAFATLWTALPGFRFWGRLFQFQPLASVLDRAYDIFLKVRPRLQAIMKTPKP